MAEPQVVAREEPQTETPDTTEPETPDTPENGDELPDADSVGQTDAVVEEGDFEGGSLFSGVEESERTEGEPDDPDEFTDDDVLPGGDDGPAPVETPNLSESEVATAINQGAARLAVVGLEDEDKERLEGEFEEVFEAFRLGYFGGEVADEYLMVNDEVDPIWGFAAAMMSCAIFAMYMRPDSDEQMEKIAGVVGGIGGDADGSDLL